MLQPSSMIADIERSIKKEYADYLMSEDRRMLEGMSRLVNSEASFPTVALLAKETVNMIHRHFPFKEISLGAKRQADGKFVYVDSVGFSPVAKMGQMEIVYTLEEMLDKKRYPRFNIGGNIFFFYAEGENAAHDKDEKAFNRPSRLGETRSSPKQMMEGDYIDFYMYGDGNDLIGWIEVASPKDGQIPNARSLGWLETFSILLAPMLKKRIVKNR